MKLFNKKNKEHSEYQKFILEEKIIFARIMFGLSAMLYALFFFIDILALPSAIDKAIIIRAGVISILVLAYLSTYLLSFSKYYSWILSLAIASALAGINALIYLATPEDQAFDLYVGGNILVLVTLFSWTYLNSFISSSLSLFSISTYLYIEIFVREALTSMRFPSLLTNMFFLISAILIGLIAQNMRDKQLLKNYNLTKTLGNSLLEKTVEANDNAYLANHDMLTGLPNRRFVMEQLEVSLTIAKEKEKLLAILFLDLNGFKQINDTYGHKAGDEILVVVARRLEAAIRRNDSISRLGGDEYLIGLLLKPEQINEIEEMREKFVSIISEPILFEGISMTVGTSIGIATYPMHGEDIGVLIDIADNKMYQHKDRRSDDISIGDDLIDRPIKDKYISLDIIDEHAFESLKNASESSTSEFEIDFVDLPAKKGHA